MAAASMQAGKHAVDCDCFLMILHRRCKELKYLEIELQWLGLTSLISSAR